MAPRVQRRRNRRRHSYYRLRRPAWIDPHPEIPGTRPEKRVFDALLRRRVFFIFQGDLPLKERQLSPLLEATEFKPDFIVPEYRIIFDPFGDFAHTQGDSIQRDYVKSILYTALGYEFIHPWTSDVERNGGDWVLSLSHNLRGPRRAHIPAELERFRALGYFLGPHLGLGATGTAAANAARRKAPSLGLRRGRRRRR